MLNHTVSLQIIFDLIVFYKRISLTIIQIICICLTHFNWSSKSVSLSSQKLFELSDNCEFILYSRYNELCLVVLWTQIWCAYILKSLHNTKTVEITLYHHLSFKSNIGHLISNYNAAEIDLSHCSCIHACKAVTFQILYHLLNTISLLSLISHCLVFTEHLRMLYLLSLFL